MKTSSEEVSAMWYRFDVQQLAARDGKLLISRDGRHFLLGGIPHEVIARMVLAYENADYVQLDFMSEQVQQTLLKANFLVAVDPATLAEYKREQGKRTRPISYLAANPVRHLGSVAGLSVMLLASILMFLYFGHAIKFTNLAEMVKDTAPLDILVAIATIVVTLVIHELGHAAAACYYAGTVGKANFRFIWGVPAVTVDTTSLALATRTGKVAISLAGGVFQVFASMILLLTVPQHGVQMGASVGIFLALFNLVPLPYYDGYWILVDLLGRKFLPKLRHAKDKLEVGYGLLLLSLFLATVPLSVRAIFGQLTGSLHMLESSPVRATFLIVFGLFAAGSLMAFGFSLMKSLLDLSPKTVESS